MIIKANLARSVALHERARALVSAFERGEPPPESRDALACDIARFQADTIDGYSRLCRARGVNITSLTCASDIPAVPTDAFKLTRVATFEPREANVVFRTSGTTQGIEARGEHAMRDGTTYDAAAVAFGKYWLARDLAPGKVMVLVLAPSAEQVPDSSLIHMCQQFAKAFGHPASQNDTFLVQDGVINLSRFHKRVATATAQNMPILLLGTSFAYVHFLDALDARVGAYGHTPLPAGSRVMQTGGYKGKSREVPAAALRRELARALRVDEREIVAEYGMTELSSQFYERTLFDAASPKGIFAEPPWARVVPVDPNSLVPVADGDVGIAKIIDAMNVDSAVAVLTEDRVRRVVGGFELLGRAPGARARGCSIAIDELLGSTRSTREKTAP
ncbi:MAG: acyl-protein synthetase [Polyangiaceae bacterium]|nr:acyl-protein synthetase [Polyangiaceae bacterium]